jgi:hypothetical protein
MFARAEGGAHDGVDGTSAAALASERRRTVTRCDTCGNEYERCLEIVYGGHLYHFDCFECAIHELAPACESCGCRIIGHGVQCGLQLYCSAHCARAHGVEGVETHVFPHVVLAR